ncbi:MAG: nucleotidyltransferase [Bacteroidota bacterium]|nr:nucleotidyltransferase [Bacteroidota bacterium]
MSTVIQSQFYKYHDTIKLEAVDNQPVIEKINMLVEELRASLKKKSEEDGKPLITFSVETQGSNAMGTGNKPAFDEDDYDIDIALLFNINKDDYTPLEVKQWVHDALNAKQFRTVEWKKPCIRVQYTEAGFPKFHVDFAIYANANTDKKIYLAKGKPTISSDQNKWEISEPKLLKNLINGKYTDSLERSQFIRCIRYYKRWKDVKFDSVNGKPTGIAITALAYNGFKPHTVEYFNGQENINDLKALIEFTKYIINQFDFFTKRIKVNLPVPPYNDLFEKMTDDQCKNFSEKLKHLKDVLEAAAIEPDPHEACKKLQKEFGQDFPVPPKEDTAQSRKRAVVGTNESA